MAASSAITSPAFRVSLKTGFSLRGEILLVIITILAMIFFVYPTAWIVIASFKTPETMFSAVDFDFTLANYVSLFKTGYARNIFNSLYLCILAVLLATFIATIAAYTFSRMRFRWKRYIFGSVLLGQCFPWIILVTPLFILFAQLGLLNNHLSMLFVYTAITIPFSIYLLVSYLEGVPRSLDEAAILDGCSRFQVIWKVIFPILLFLPLQTRLASGLAAGGVKQ